MQRPGDRGQQDVESEDKNCATYNWSIRNNYVWIRSEPAVAAGSPTGHRATEGHTNEHCTQHSVSAGVNSFDLLLRAGLIRGSRPNQ